jgi:predicted metalloprotease with PDZ domain
MEARGTLNLAYSIGLALARDGTVTGVRWGSPAYDAGLVTGVRVIAVNSMAYSPDRIRQALQAAAANGRPIDLLVMRDDRYWTASVANGGGLRYPWLERASAGPARLDGLLAARTKAGR